VLTGCGSDFSPTTAPCRAPRAGAVPWSLRSPPAGPSHRRTGRPHGESYGLVHAPGTYLFAALPGGLDRRNGVIVHSARGADAGFRHCLGNGPPGDIHEVPRVSISALVSVVLGVGFLSPMSAAIVCDPLSGKAAHGLDPIHGLSIWKIMFGGLLGTTGHRSAPIPTFGLRAGRKRPRVLQAVWGAAVLYDAALWPLGPAPCRNHCRSRTVTGRGPDPEWLVTCGCVGLVDAWLLRSLS